MNFTFLPEPLRPIALTAIAFFRTQWGVSKFLPEMAIDNRVSWKPTLQAKMSDHHLLCVEVSETPWPSFLDAAVLEMKQHCLPVRLVVALSEGERGQNYVGDVSRARSLGVGILEVGSGGTKLLHNPLPLSLTGVRPVELKKFPAKYRYDVSLALDTFLGGNPAKGCSDVYDVVESLTRRLYKKVSAKGYWRKPKSHEVMPILDPEDENVPWSKLMRTLRDYLDYRKCPSIKRNLLDRVLAIVPHRNESAHRPNTTAQLVKRDTQLRTRFENAVDLLADLIVATRPLRLYH